MNIFLDIGQKGAISFFEKEKLIKVISYQLSAKSKKNPFLKIKNFQLLLQEKFKEREKIEKVGLFIPFGKNRKTIIHLAMLNAVVILFFQEQKVIFLNEWEVFLKVLQLKKIPAKTLKKQLTIAWSQKQFLIKVENDDQADALLGGYYLVKFANSLKLIAKK